MWIITQPDEVQECLDLRMRGRVLSSEARGLRNQWDNRTFYSSLLFFPSCNGDDRSSASSPLLLLVVLHEDILKRWDRKFSWPTTFSASKFWRTPLIEAPT